MEACEKLDTYLANLRAGKAVIGPRQTVQQYLEHWLEDSRRLRVRLTTLNSCRKMLRAYLVPALGHVQLDQLSREHVQALYARLYDGGLAPQPIALAHMVLSSALKEAVKNGVLARNVCETVTLPKRKRYAARVLTAEECQRLIAAARGHRLWFFILMAITTGARRGELTALRWADIDEISRLVHLRRTVVFVPRHGHVEHEPKMVHGLRSVTLSQLALDGLPEQKMYLDRVRRIAGPAWGENGLVFPNRHGGYMDGSVVLQQFKSILQKAGLPDMHFHDLRHSAATLLLAVGVNAKVVQEMLGHSDIRITLGMYGHVMPNMQKEAIHKLDDMLK